MILVCAMLVSMAVHGQWHVGVTAGTDYNVYTMDKQYESDWQLQGRWGATVGITGQYDVTDWLGIRADICTFYNNLFADFSYIQFSSWAKYVPDPAKAIAPTADESDIKAVVDFVFMDEKELVKYIIKNSQKSVGRRAALDDNSIIAFRKSDKSMPYYLQAYRELGSYCYDYSLVDGSYLTKKLAEEVGNLSSVENMFSKRYPGQWDGGKLMTSVHQWAATTTTQPIIFIYSYNDPWTANAIEDTEINPSRKVWKVINLIGTHSYEFLSKDKCDEAASKAIKDVIQSVLNITL